MKKNQFIKVSAFLFAVALSSSAMVVQAKAITPKKQITANKVVAQNEKEDKAIAAVEALFTDYKHSAIKPDTTQADIDNAKALVNDLPAGPVKDYLMGSLAFAQYFFDVKEAAINVIYPLYRDDEHTYIREDLTKDEVNYALRVGYSLATGYEGGKLLILAIKADRQFDSREATFALFSDDAHNTIKAGLTQTDINKAKELVDTLLDTWAIKDDLNKLITVAQHQLDEKMPQLIVQPAI